MAGALCLGAEGPEGAMVALAGRQAPAMHLGPAELGRGGPWAWLGGFWVPGSAEAMLTGARGWQDPEPQDGSSARHYGVCFLLVVLGIEPKTFYKCFTLSHTPGIPAVYIVTSTLSQPLPPMSLVFSSKGFVSQAWQHIPL